MSANVELVRAIYAAWERGDWGDAWWAAPGIEFVIADGPDRRTITGVDEMASTWREFLGAWSGYAVSGEEFRALDDERVLALLNATGRGKASGVDIADGSERGANVFTIRDGAVARLAIYFDHRDALAELGLDA
jgi:ketosteroid isomerase-like protein